MVRTKESNEAEFASYIFPDHLLESAIEWIRRELHPEAVFSKEHLNRWAWDNGFRKFE